MFLDNAAADLSSIWQVTSVYGYNTVDLSKQTCLWAESTYFDSNMAAAYAETDLSSKLHLSMVITLWEI